MVSKDSKFEKLTCERLPFATGLLSFTNSDQLKIKEQSEQISWECWLPKNAVMTGESLEGTMSPDALVH